MQLDCDAQTSIVKPELRGERESEGKEGDLYTRSAARSPPTYEREPHPLMRLNRVTITTEVQWR